ncbi:MAG: aminotransferase class V-fold PLP-dependent enzyme [Thaumarchaeota archaeon]|nr:aminotransferase class V-fold PLP-dependent enzyme [Nitrososphaerota archaeon]
MLKTEAIDVAKIREDFPILRRKVHGKRLVYLDNAATTQKPQSVIDSLVDYYSRYNSNVHRSVHTLGEEATAAYEGARKKAADFVRSQPKELVFVRGTTEATNLVRFAWGEKNVKKGDTLVTTLMEHHSNIVPWQLLAKSKGADLKFVGLNSDGTLDMGQLENLLKESPRLVAVTHCSNVLGTINDVQSVCAKARSAGATTVVDGAQSVPHMPVDVGAIGADFYAYSVTGDTPILIQSGNSVQLIPIEEAVTRFDSGEALSVFTLNAVAQARFMPISGSLAHLDDVYDVSHESSALPVTATAHHSLYVWRDGNLVEERVGNLRKGDYLVTLNTQSGPNLRVERKFSFEFEHHGHALRESTSITRELMRLVGYYLAEGSIDSHGARVSFAFGDTEEEYVDDVVSLIGMLEPVRFYSEVFGVISQSGGLSLAQLARQTGVSQKTVSKYSNLDSASGFAKQSAARAHVWHNRNNHTLTVSFSSKKWYEFFKKFCGTKRNKHLPSFVWRVSFGLVAELLKGYLRGDASKNEEYRLRVKSVSRQLVSELSWLLKLNGVSNTLGFSKTRVPNWNDEYSLVIQRTELASIPEFYMSCSKPDSPRDKMLPVDALRKAWKAARPAYNSRFASALRRADKRTTRAMILEITEWIESTHTKPITEDILMILDHYKLFARGDFGLIKVRSTKPVGRRRVYDISVAGTERFFGGFYPILLHNSGHKMLGPTGIGALVAKKKILEEMDPFHGGGEMIKEVFEDHSTWNDVPYKFEAGTVNIADAIGMGAAVDYLTSIGMDRVRDHELKILDYALGTLREVKGFHAYGPQDTRKRGGVVSFNYADVHPHDLATILDEEGIAIRSGHHCAQPLMRWLDVPATSRASFYVYNSYDDVDALRAGIQRAGVIFKV